MEIILGIVTIYLLILTIIVPIVLVNVLSKVGLTVKVVQEYNIPEETFQDIYDSDGEPHQQDDVPVNLDEVVSIVNKLFVDDEVSNDG